MSENKIKEKDWSEYINDEFDLKRHCLSRGINNTTVKNIHPSLVIKLHVQPVKFFSKKELLENKQYNYPKLLTDNYIFEQKIVIDGKENAETIAKQKENKGYYVELKKNMLMSMVQDDDVYNIYSIKKKETKT